MGYYQIVITGHKEEMDVNLVLNNLSILFKSDPKNSVHSWLLKTLSLNAQLILRQQKNIKRFLKMLDV